MANMIGQSRTGRGVPWCGRRRPTLPAERRKGGIAIEVRREPGDGYWSNVRKKQPFYMTFISAARPRIRSARSPTCRLRSGTRRALSARTSTSSYAALVLSIRKEMYHDATMIVRDNGEAMIPIFGDFSDKRKLSDRNQPKRVRRPSEERHDSSPNPHLRAVPRIGGLNRSTPSAKAGLRGHP